MDRQKITIKPKPSPVIKEKLTVPDSKTKTKSKPKSEPVDSRVYTIGTSKKASAKCISNNIIQLQLYLADIKAIEATLEPVHLLSSIDDKPIVPKAWNEHDGENSIVTTTNASESASASASASAADLQEGQTAPKKDPFKAIIKRTIVEFKDESSSSDRGTDAVSRKDLIINSGIKRQTKQLLQVFAKEWPAHSPYACWTDCHTFDSTPVGIPHSLIDGVFYCYGNFCSYNCAKRYLCPNVEDDDDIAMMQTIHDIFIRDDKSEKLQLLELLCHIETGNPLNEPIRMSPKRMILKLFGGDKTIEEYRSNFNKNTTYHVFKSPLVPISYQMEECSNKGDTKKKTRAVSLDTLKLQRAFDSLMQEKEKNDTILRKLLKTETRKTVGIRA
jgi:hypothetical protein